MSDDHLKDPEMHREVEKVLAMATLMFRDCPCCSGAAYHRKQIAVDDFKEVKCASCDEDGQVAVCGECDGDAVFGLWPSATECYACRGSGLDFNECDMAKTLENTRERPAAEDF